MRKTASSFSSAKQSHLKSRELDNGARSTPGSGAPHAEQQAQAIFAHAPGLRQVQTFFSLLDEPAGLRQALLQQRDLQPLFLEHVSDHDAPGQDEPAAVAENLDQVVAHTPLPVLQRFLFAHYLSDAGSELEAEELSLRAIQRGRFLELLAEECSLGMSPESAFLAGGLSTMPEMTGVRLEEILPLLHAPQEVRDLLLESAATSKGHELLTLAQHIEAGDWNACQDRLAAYHIPGERAATLYGKAAIWTWMLLG